MQQDSYQKATLFGAGALTLGHLVLHGSVLARGTETYSFELATAILTLFCLFHARWLVGFRCAVAFLVIGSVLGWFFEYMGVSRGFLFGHYEYTAVLGPKLGGVPYLIAPSWFVLIYIGYALANLIVAGTPRARGGAGQILLLSLMGGFIITTYDLVFDPFMTQKMKVWIMPDGDYFGQPAHVFVGWIIATTIISLAFRTVERWLGPAPTRPVPVLHAAFPIVIYGGWCLFFAILGDPPGTRPISLFALGIPVLAASAALLRSPSGAERDDGAVTLPSPPP